MNAFNFETDFISPRISSEYVISLAEDVTIKEEGIRKLSQMVTIEKYFLI